ncbi:MAG: hypothetical protein WCL08_13725 [Verrucomicrobiota bacterium]
MERDPDRKVRAQAMSDAVLMQLPTVNALGSQQILALSLPLTKPFS